ncbi:helix-turn-helix domain-containing protein [Thermaurantiacus sp.]
MSGSPPLLRASAVIPLELWLEAHGRPASELFRDVGLPPSPAAVPHRLVPMRAFITLLELFARTVGPDFGVRLTGPEALMRLDTPWRAIRTSGTIREALQKVSRTFHWHAPNVFFLANPVRGGLEVTEATPRPGSDQALHQVQQHVAGFVSCLGQLALGWPLPGSYFITPHPVCGVEHLKPWLGPDVHPAEGNKLRIRIADDVLETAFPWQPEPECLLLPPGEPASPSGLAESLRLLIAGLVEDGQPGLDLLARSIGSSRRTLQRRLADEGTSYAALLDSARRDLALRQLHAPGTAISSIARVLGYRQASSLTRAVRRWADDSPRQLRKRTGAR